MAIAGIKENLKSLFSYKIRYKEIINRPNSMIGSVVFTVNIEYRYIKAKTREQYKTFLQTRSPLLNRLNKKIVASKNIKRFNVYSLTILDCSIATGDIANKNADINPTFLLKILPNTYTKKIETIPKIIGNILAINKLGLNKQNKYPVNKV